MGSERGGGHCWEGQGRKGQGGEGSGEGVGVSWPVFSSMVRQ